MIELIIDDKYFIEKPYEGNPDIEPDVVRYSNNISKWDCPRKRIGNGQMWVDISDADFDITHFHWIVGYLGGTITGYRGFIELPTVELDDIVPDYLPNRVDKNYDYSDPENILELEDTYKTWRDWIKPNYTLTEIGDYTYFCTQASGRDLTDVELLQLGTKFVEHIPEQEETII